MRQRTRLAALILAALAAQPAAAEEAEMTWSRAAGYLKQERQAGEGCARVIKRFLPPGDLAARSRAELDYDKAGGVFNGLIAELQTALADKTEASALGDFEERVAAGTAAREALCRQAEALAPPPPSPGDKGIAETVAATVGKLAEAGIGVWERIRDDDAVRRAAISTELGDATWPDFAAIEAGA
jgi:hypothetical protein